MRYLKNKNQFLLEKKRLGTRKQKLEKSIKSDGTTVDGGYVVNVRRSGELVDIIVDDKWSYKKYEDGVDQSEHEYIGGIDSNGFIVGLHWGGEGDKYLLDSDGGNVVLDPNGDPWKRTKDPEVEQDKPSVPEYTDLVGDEATGWVNVKIDEELLKRVKRFSLNLSREDGLTGLREKIDYLSRPTKKRARSGETFTQTTQRKISAIILLKYLQEIKDNFNPTTGGFLFESFIGGLLDGEVPDDNRKADVTHKGSTYQLKFVDWMPDKGTIPLVKYYVDENGNHSTKRRDPIFKNSKKVRSSHITAFDERNDLFCDYYVIALKQHTKIYIYMLNSKGPETPYGGGTRGNKYSISHFLTESGLSISELRKKEKTYSVLDLSTIDSNLEEVGTDLRESLNSIWTNLSEIEYNIETITTGVNKNKETVEADEYESLYSDSTDRLNTIKDDLKRLKGTLGTKK